MYADCRVGCARCTCAGCAALPKRSGCERSSAALQPAVQQVVLLFVASLLRSAEREAARLFEHSEFAQRRFPQKCFFFSIPNQLCRQCGVRRSASCSQTLMSRTVQLCAASFFRSLQQVTLVRGSDFPLASVRDRFSFLDEDNTVCTARHGTGS